MATIAVSKKNKTKAKEVAKKTASSAKKGLEKTGKAIVSNPKTALYVLGGAIAIYVGYRIFKTLNKGFDNVLNPDIDDTIDVGTIDTSGATISNEQAFIFANQLLKAMNAKQPLWGTDEETILKIFKQISSQDFRVIYNVFGTKDYNGNNSPPTGIFANIDSYEPHDLVYWLNSELSPGDGEVYRLVKKTVNDAGFAF